MLYQDYISKSVPPFPCVKVKTSNPRNWTTTTTTTYINIPFKTYRKLQIISYSRIPGIFSSPKTCFFSFLTPTSFLITVPGPCSAQKRKKQAYLCRIQTGISEKLPTGIIFMPVFLGYVPQTNHAQLGYAAQKTGTIMHVFKNRHNYACFSEKQAYFSIRHK